MNRLLLAYYRGLIDGSAAHAHAMGDVQIASRRAEPGRLKLNLGCGPFPLEGFVNVDIAAGEGIEVHDLRKPWPWEDSSVDFILASHIFEHLPEKIFTMNEAWRVLQPGGRIEIALPTTEGPGAWQDPTHVSFWNRRSFLYYEDGSGYREGLAVSYGIKARFRVLWERTDEAEDGPILTIILEAAKIIDPPATTADGY